jgi:hypothetical protein
LQIGKLTYSYQAIPTIKDGGNHTHGFAASAATLEAHYACLDVTKALAATGVRVLIDDEFLAQVIVVISFKPYSRVLKIMLIG